MALKGIGALPIHPVMPGPTAAIPSAGTPKSGFAQRLGELVGGVDQMDDKKNQLQADMVAGRPVDAHEITIAAEEADLAFRLMLEVRNKMLEAYQEIIRMQA